MCHKVRCYDLLDVSSYEVYPLLINNNLHALVQGRKGLAVGHNIVTL